MSSSVNPVAYTIPVILDLENLSYTLLVMLLVISAA